MEVCFSSEDNCGAHGFKDSWVNSMDDQERHYIGDLLADDDVFQTNQSNGPSGTLSFAFYSNRVYEMWLSSIRICLNTQKVWNQKDSVGKNTVDMCCYDFRLCI